MSTLNIPDVPDEVRDQLAAQAAAQGKPLPDYVRDVLAQQAHRNRNQQVLAQLAGRGDGSHLSGTELDEQIERFRTERDDRW